MVSGEVIPAGKWGGYIIDNFFKLTKEDSTTLLFLSIDTYSFPINLIHVQKIHSYLYNKEQIDIIDISAPSVSGKSFQKFFLPEYAICAKILLMYSIT